MKRIRLHSDLEQEDHHVCIEIMSDTISEPNEGFLLVMSVKKGLKHDGASTVALAVILDNDSELFSAFSTLLFVSLSAVVEVGFDRLSYTCTESEPNSCVLCAAVLNGASLETGLQISLLLLTHSSTAIGRYHTKPIPQ